MKYLSLILMSILVLLGCKSNSLQKVPKWGIFESELNTRISYEDPFNDVELRVRCIRPDSSVFDVTGFYDGGNMWKFRIMPDMLGAWKFKAFFSDEVKELTGGFECVISEKPGPLTVLEANPIWMVHKDAKPRQIRSFHVGDRFFASNFDNPDRVQFLDWISDQGYNMLSIASHYLNRQQEGRGLGWDTPRLWPLDPVEYQKLEAYLDELERRGIVAFPFAGFFGQSANWPVDHKDQQLYIKYTLARLAPYWNLILNVAGPEPLLKPENYQNGNMTKDDINRLAELIKKYDPYDHALSVHNRTRNDRKEYEGDPFIFEPWEDYATLQGGKSADVQEVYEFIMDNRKVTKPVYAQEVLWYGNMYHADLNEDQLRKKAITLLMAGSFINFGDMDGNSSSGFSGNLNLANAHADAHNVMHKVWNIFDDIPFQELIPWPDLVEKAICLADGTGKYLVYCPLGEPFYLKTNKLLSGIWINPRDPTDRRVFNITSINSALAPPDENDWLCWIDAN